MPEKLCDNCRFTDVCGCEIVQCIRYSDHSKCTDTICTVYQPCSGDDRVEADGWVEEIDNFYDQPQEEA
jgi:hypothetical protein